MVKSGELDDLLLTEEARFERDLLATAPAAVRLARSLGRSPEDAAEAVQEAAARAWKYRASLTGEWRPWFLSIVYRTGRRRVPDWLPLPRGWDRAGQTWPGKAAPDPILANAMARLPARQRAALSLFYGEDMTLQATARVLGLTSGGTKQLLARARASLRRHYQALSEGEAT